MAIKNIIQPQTAVVIWQVMTSAKSQSQHQKKLCWIIKNNAGRNSQGKITVRHQGGGHKRAYCVIDFKRNKDNVEGVVHSIEYDPNRTNIALIHSCRWKKLKHTSLSKRFKAGQRIESGENADIKVGNAYC